MTITNGFGDIEVADIIINGATIGALNLSSAVIDCILDRNIQGASSVTIQFADPEVGRPILNSGLWVLGTTVEIDGLEFTYISANKAGDQLQIEFESMAVNQLRQQSGTIATTSSTDITGFAQMLVSQVPGIGFVGYPGLATTEIDGALAVADAVGRGTSDDPTEDSWTCLQRIATTAGWRCFEANNIIYFGPDTFWLTFPVAATFQEFTDTIENMDFSWDWGQPLGDLTATAIINHGIDYIPGQPINVVGMGPATATWLVSDMQRDFFNPLASIVLTIPLSPDEILNEGITGGDITNG